MIDCVGNPTDRVSWRAGACCVLLVLVLIGCTNGDSGSDWEPELEPSATAAHPTVDEGTASFVPVDPTPTPLVRPTTILSPTTEPIPEAVAVAIQRAATDYEVSPAAVELLSYVEATWSSTALGCPEPGRSYAQIVTSGYEVVLDVVDEPAVYHVDQTGMAIVECEGQTVGP